MTDHKQNIITMLLWVGILLLAGEFIVSVTFQLMYATTPTQKLVAVMYGVGMPLATISFMASFILFKNQMYSTCSFVLFLLLFLWGWHGQGNYLLDELEHKNSTSQVAKVQNERLKTIQQRLDAMPISGAKFDDSIDKQIRLVKSELDRCPANQMTICRKPLQAQYNDLLLQKQQNGVEAQIKLKRDELLKEKQIALNAMSGTDADIEDAKVMPVYKGMAWFFNVIGFDVRPKQMEYLLSIIGTFLYSIIACSVFGVRTKLIMESEVNSPALSSNYYQQPFSKPKATEKPESWFDRYKSGDVSLAGAVFGRDRNQQSAQTTANADVNIGDFADAINRRNAVTADAINETPERGRGEFREFDDAIIATEVNTTSPTLIAGVGFGAPEIPNPNYQAPARPPVIHWQQENPSGVEIDLPEAEAEEVPHPAIPEPTRMSTPVPTQSGIASMIVGDRGRDTDLEYIAIKETILDGRFFNHFDNVSIQSLKDCPKLVLLSESGIGQSKATRFREYARTDLLPMSRAEWVSRFGDKDLTREYKNA